MLIYILVTTLDNNDTARSEPKLAWIMHCRMCNGAGCRSCILGGMLVSTSLHWRPFCSEVLQLCMHELAAALSLWQDLASKVICPHRRLLTSLPCSAPGAALTFTSGTPWRWK